MTNLIRDQIRQLRTPDRPRCISQQFDTVEDYAVN